MTITAMGRVGGVILGSLFFGGLMLLPHGARAAVADECGLLADPQSADYGRCLTCAQQNGNNTANSGFADCYELGGSANSADPVTPSSSPPARGTTTATPPQPVQIINPLGITDPREFIGRVIQAIMSIIGSITLLMFVYGGVLWITSMGEKDKVEKGKKIMTWCVLGLGVIASSYVIVNAVIQGLSTGVAS